MAQERTCQFSASKLTLPALIIYTAARIGLNLAILTIPGQFREKFDASEADYFVKPLVAFAGVCVVLRRQDSSSAMPHLHRWCRINISFLTVFIWDPWFAELLLSLKLEDVVAGHIAVVWQLGSCAMQLHTTNVKLLNLSLPRLAVLCEITLLKLLLPGVILLIVGMSALSFDESLVRWGRFCLHALLGFGLAVVLLQSTGLAYVAFRAHRQHEWHEIRSTVSCLWANVILGAVGPALTVYVVMLYFPQGYGATADISFQICNSLLLSGMVGWKEWASPLESFHQLAEAAGMGMSYKRIAFPGAINPHARLCVASFPGKYSELWDRAVVVASGTDDVCSLACVFLTDPASGLGQHAPNPDSPDECWCRALYGRVPPIAYLSIVDATAELDEDVLAFKKADAAAMGQYLLIKTSHVSTLEWETQLADALKKAQVLCLQNGGRAPWGCEWFLGPAKFR